MKKRIYSPEKGWHDVKVYTSEEVIELLEKSREIGIDEIIKRVLN